jgi:hypothetical protein
MEGSEHRRVKIIPPIGLRRVAERADEYRKQNGTPWNTVRRVTVATEITII